MQFTVTIACNNAAFTDEHTGEPDPGPELGRILGRLQQRIDGVPGGPGRIAPGDSWPILDANGNIVGSAEFHD